MTATPTQSTTDPFTCGLPREVVFRLISGRFTKGDYRLYLRTDHWKVKKAEVFQSRRFCALCDNPASQVHHTPRAYKRLFDENTADLTPLCRPCHKRTHRR